MGWRWGWRGPWPGNGPWSHLPPWMRPGWVFGRGWCWRYLLPYWASYYYPYNPWVYPWRHWYPWYWAGPWSWWGWYYYPYYY